MAMGNNYSNNQNSDNKQSNNSISIYSNYRMNNGDSELDPTCITFTFWKSNLKVGIFPRKQGTGKDGQVQFDMSSGVTIYLSHTKARIFKEELEKFLEDPVKYNSRGVPSGSAVICISNGVDFGKDNPVIAIYKTDENGNVVTDFAYEIKRNFHFSLRNYKGGSDFIKEFGDYQDLEIRQIITLLDEYIKASTNAVAFTVMDQRSYSANRIETKINAIAQSLGVQLPTSGGKRYDSNAFFNSHGDARGQSDSSGDNDGVGFGTASIDDLE